MHVEEFPQGSVTLYTRVTVKLLEQVPGTTVLLISVKVRVPPELSLNVPPPLINAAALAKGAGTELILPMPRMSGGHTMTGGTLSVT